MRRHWFTFRTSDGRDVAKLAADHAWTWSDALAMAQRLANSSCENIFVSGNGMSRYFRPESRQ